MAEVAPRILVIVPARYASTRFPGKPLIALRGGGGVAKPLIQWSWEAATRSRRYAAVVATDDARIADVVRGFGGSVAMTSAAAANGTERCAQWVAGLVDPPDLVINLQGDAPLVPPGYLDALVDTWRKTGDPVLTPYVVCDAATEARLLADAAAGRVGGTTLVSDAHDRALYFSKRPIPYRAGREPPLKLHVGLYAYTPAALTAYAAHPAPPIEEAEGLEQLRFLDMGMTVRAVPVPAVPGGLWELNNPSDVPLVEQGLQMVPKWRENAP